MKSEKENFIRIEMFPLLEKLSPDAQSKWGKMNAQQMLEHLADFFNVSAGIIKFDLVTPEEHLPKFREFLFSEKQFRENTKAPVHIVGEEPMPARCGTIRESIDWVKQAVDNFVEYFKEHPESKTTHPVFGELDYNEWVQLHHKHVTHHLRQFGLLTSD
jgi:hypothetical protein